MRWQEYLEANRERFIAELLEFVTIPSVSAKGDNAADVDRAADWVATRIAAAGMRHVAVMPTGGHPVVYGDWLEAGEGCPTVLIYGHFDVQPADPFELWDSPPFKPEIREDRVWGRGASDDKGGMLIPILAVEAMLRTRGALPVNVKFLFEGQEEIGSPDLPGFVAAHRDLLAADMIFSADGLQWGADQPMLVSALKGLVGAEITVEGPDDDQHSGLHGGGVANPVLALAQLLASMKSPDGRVTIEGFYDDVRELSPAERAEIAQVPFDEAAYVAELGVPEVAASRSIPPASGSGRARRWT